MENKQLPKWVRYRAAAYLRGKGLSIGVPSLIDNSNIFPILAHEGTVYNINVDIPQQHSMVMGGDISIFNRESFDHIITTSDNKKLDDVVSKLKVNGHLILLCDNTHYIPKGSWKLKESKTIDNIGVTVLKKLSGRDNVIEPIKLSNNRPRVCIARYGAIGDALQLTPIIHQLYDDGYDVTLNVSPYTEEIYKYNPYISNIVCQERNIIPNSDLGEYWDYWSKEYDRYINLSESIEGKLLKVEGRSDFYTPSEYRRSICNINYHDQHMKLAGLEHNTKYDLPELYFSQSELKDINYELRPLRDYFTIVWAMRGSSEHKLYPFYKEVAMAWLSDHKDSYILSVGGAESQQYEFNYDRLIPLANKWPLRKSLLLTKYVDLVIGPESAIVNASSCFDTPKICLLSHSSKYNLTHYWTNNYSLEPDKSISPCYPCHQLHYKLDSCPVVDLEFGATKVDKVINNLPVCTTAISPSVLYNQINTVYQLWLNSRIVE